MRIGGVVGIVLFACICGFCALAPAAEPADQYVLLPQGNHEISAAKQRPRSKPAPGSKRRAIIVALPIPLSDRTANVTASPNIFGTSAT
jgi:hypothetical protein